MSNQQKSAWYILAVGLLIAATYLTLRLTVNGAVAPVAFALFALTALTPTLFPIESRDERVRLITHRAGLIGGGAAYLFVIATCMLVWWSRFRATPPTVDVNILPLIAMGAGLALMLVQSVTVLFLANRPLDASTP